MSLYHAAIGSRAGGVQLFFSLGLGNSFVYASNAVAKLFVGRRGWRIVFAGAGLRAAFEGIDWGFGARGKNRALNDLGGHDVLAGPGMFLILNWKPFLFLNCPLLRVVNFTCVAGQGGIVDVGARHVTEPLVVDELGN